jgi:two-component system sensor histidine kinase UhpB
MTKADQSTEQSIAPSKLPSRQLRILLLEDVDADAILIERQLRRAKLKFSTQVVESRTAFLQELQQNPPDIILADYQLPQFDGMSALMLAQEFTPRTPVIIVTGSINEETAVECMKAGAADYVLKDGLIRLGTAVISALEKRDTEDQLRRSQELFRLICDSVTDLIEVIDVSGRRMFLCPSSGKFMGTTVSTGGELLFDVIHPDDRESVRKLFQETLDSGIGRRAEYRFLTQDGSVRYVESQWNVIRKVGDGGVRVVVVTRDVTERKRAEDQLRRSHWQLRALTRHLQSIREEERTRIAREVHDELGQQLTALKMDLAGLAAKVSSREAPDIASWVDARIHSMSDLVNTMIQTVRKIATELRPLILDDLGLVAAIDWQAQEFQNRTGIRCECIGCTEDLELDRDRSTALFRILQESLTNVARHSRASAVTIKLHPLRDRIVLTVRDNGIGITEKEISDPRSLGILGMRERARIFGGELTFTGSSGKGTTVEVLLPIEERREVFASQTSRDRNSTSG